MPEIVRVYREQAPESRFIGLRYQDADRVDGAFAAHWEEWFGKGRFDALSSLVDGSWRAVFPEADSYIGLMKMRGNGLLEYWIGMFLPPGTAVPEGFRSLDFPPMDLGVCLVRGREPEIFRQCDACLIRLDGERLALQKDSGGVWQFMERYQCPRFTQPDSEGQKILDMVFLVEAPDEQPLRLEGMGYCAGCFMAFEGEKCPGCGKKGAALQPDDPIFLGEVPSALRNALQIAFSATEIPFTAMPTLGSGFTLAAGDIFETYKLYVPYERSAEAQEKLESLFTQYRAED